MTVRTADRTLSIFEVFGAEQRPMMLAELASLLDVPLSSCHGLAKTLLQRGYLYLTNRRRELYPTRKLLHLAETITAHDPYLERLRPVLEALRNEVRETVIIGTRQGDAVLYLDVLEGPQSIRYSARPGDFKPLHSSSIGKAMLGTMSQAELTEWLSKHSLPAVTAATITAPAQLEKEISESRQRGFFVTRGENVADVTAVATSMSVNSQPIGIAIAGPSHRMVADLDGLARKLVTTCATIAEHGP